MASRDIEYVIVICIAKSVEAYAVAGTSFAENQVEAK